MPSLWEALFFIGAHFVIIGSYFLLMFGISEWENKRKAKRAN